jgi:uncharacterized membrane protein
MSNPQADNHSKISDKVEIVELEKALKQNNPQVFKGLDNNKKREILTTIASFTIHQERTHSGPLPDSETMTAYNQIIPNGADRIMIMAENQSAHRISIESSLVKSQSQQSSRGQIFGFIIGLVGLISGSLLIYLGHTAGGSIIGGGTVVSLVTVFVLGKKSQKT